MTTRSSTTTVSFSRPFRLDEIDRELPAGDYSLEVEDEALDGLSFLAYRRIATYLFVRSSENSAVEMWTIDPEGLDSALAQDRAAAR